MKDWEIWTRIKYEVERIFKTSCGVALEGQECDDGRIIEEWSIFIEEKNDQFPIIKDDSIDVLIARLKEMGFDYVEWWFISEKDMITWSFRLSRVIGECDDDE